MNNGKYWNGESDETLMRKEIEYLNKELSKERARMTLLAKIARESQTGLTIAYDIPDLDSDKDDAIGGFYLMEKRKVHPKRYTIGLAIDAANANLN